MDPINFNLENSKIGSALSTNVSSSSTTKSKRRQSHVCDYFIQEIEHDGVMTERVVCKHCTCEISNFTYNQLKMREGLAVYVASTKQPLTFGENSGFEKFIKNYIQPEFSKVSRKTLISDCVNIFEKRKKILISELASYTGVISFTSEIWTSMSDVRYLRLAAHYIDSNTWMLNKKIIAFRMLEYPCSNEYIFQCFSSILDEYSIENKCFGITFDKNEDNIIAMGLFREKFVPPYEGQLFQVRCVCDMINLMVEDGLKLMKVTIEKITYAILFIVSSPDRQQEFENLCNASSLQPKRFEPAFVTRWDTIYFMLKSCKGYENVITDINAKHGNLSIENKEWEYVFNFMQLLEAFYTATIMLSNVYYPTSSIVLRHLYDVSATFVECRNYPIYSNICRVMEERFKKYWEHIPRIFYLSSVMDPSMKLDSTQMLMQGICDNLNMHLHITSEEVVNMLYSLYNSYEQKYAATLKRSSLPLPSVKKNSDRALKFLSERRKARASTNPLAQNELYKYLEAFLGVVDEEDFELLSWWRTHSKEFPVLSIMVRDLLTLPVSAIVLEDALSPTGGRMLCEKRTRLDSNILEALVCLKDWEDAKYRSQNFVEDFADDFWKLNASTDD